ncbi:AIM24 family protein, partial [Streptomyces sp. MK37H]|nr:AIM24 family protein [Streptomyces sp. MK37H]
MPFNVLTSRMVEAQVLPGQTLFSQRGAMLA